MRLLEILAVVMLLALPACQPSICECETNRGEGEDADPEITEACDALYDSMTEEERVQANRDLKQCK